jgi:hypothetical protein
MNFTIVFLILSSVLTIAAVIPYLVEVVKGKTKPRIVSWFIWTLLTGIASVAALVDGQYFTAILLFSAVVETLAVVILGWKNGDRKIERIDAVCLIGAIIGIILWQIFNSPAIAVIATVSIDLVGGAPTLIHSWKSPNEETWITFFLSFLGAACTLLIVNEWSITSVVYPIYLVVINILFSSVIIIRRQTKKLRT